MATLFSLAAANACQTSAVPPACVERLTRDQFNPAPDTPETGSEDFAPLAEIMAMSSSPAPTVLNFGETKLEAPVGSSAVTNMSGWGTVVEQVVGAVTATAT